MSFSVEFLATKADAVKILEKEYLPSEVRLFLRQALSVFAPSDVIAVRAVGHLYDGDFQQSNAEIAVRRMTLREAPKG